MLTSVTGINWGDEGKGRVIDLLAENADIVVRYQGGNNAGHTVVTNQGKFVLNLLPSGILHPDVICILGDGMVVDLEHLANEIKQIEDRGISINPKHLKLSKKATISMPWHRIQDELEEKNLELAGCYHQEPMSYPALLDWCREQSEKFSKYICDTGTFIDKALYCGKKVILEAQLGALRDIDYGIFPYTSSSSTISAYGPIGAGIPARHADHVVGVLKAYSTCVGAGPFVAENAVSEKWQQNLREAGGEFGAATGRPRRVGPFDAVASRYGLRCQHADKIALTKLDVLSSMKEIPIITGYNDPNGSLVEFDPTDNLDLCTPVIYKVPGWEEDISHCRTFDDLPVNARNYIKTIEEMLHAEINFISVGAKRDEYLLKGEWL